MVLARGALAIGLLLLWVYALLSAITADAARVRNLPKPVWIAIVLLLPLVGSVVWLVAGRPKSQPGTVSRDGGGSKVPPEYDRPGRAVASNPDDDAAFLEQVRRRAEEQRRKAIEEQQRRKDEGGPAPA